MIDWTFAVLCFACGLLSLTLTELTDRLKLRWFWFVGGMLYLLLAIYAMIFMVQFVCASPGCWLWDACHMLRYFKCLP